MSTNPVLKQKISAKFDSVVELSSSNLRNEPMWQKHLNWYFYTYMRYGDRSVNEIQAFPDFRLAWLQNSVIFISFLSPLYVFPILFFFYLFSLRLFSWDRSIYTCDIVILVVTKIGHLEIKKQQVNLLVLMILPKIRMWNPSSPISSQTNYQVLKKSMGSVFVNLLLNYHKIPLTQLKCSIIRFFYRISLYSVLFKPVNGTSN